MAAQEQAGEAHFSTKNGLRDVANYIRANYDIVAELAETVDPGEEFTFVDVPDHFQPRLEKWKDEGIISLERVDEDSPRHGGSPRKVWTVSTRIVDWIDGYSPRSPEVPCGHHGFKNLGNGTFECPHEWCDERFTSMQLSRALNTE